MLSKFKGSNKRSKGCRKQHPKLILQAFYQCTDPTFKMVCWHRCTFESMCKKYFLLKGVHGDFTAILPVSWINFLTIENVITFKSWTG